jgi:hypothetical protein
LKYTTTVTLGATYTDSVTKYKGKADAVTFFTSDCQRVSLLTLQDGSVHSEGADVVALEGDRREKVYESDIVLGEQYQDRLTKVRGVAVDVTFHSNFIERVHLEWLGDHGALQSYTFDADRLTRVDTGVAVKTKEGQTGGPERRSSGAPRNPTRR